MLEDSDFALDMIPIADRFSVLDLKRLCERTLICAMSVDNVARIFALADRYACNRLRSRALLFMTEPGHFHSVMKTDSFAELDKALILEILHSHNATPAPALVPSAPLPGNSATAAKVGQSKLRDHRHARGGAGAGSAGTARPVSGIATVPLGSEHGRASTSGASASSTSAMPHTLGVLTSARAAPDGPPPSSAIPSIIGTVSAQPLAVDPTEDMALSSSRSSTVDEPSLVNISGTGNALPNNSGVA